MDARTKWSTIVGWIVAVALLVLVAIKIVFIGYFQIPQNGMFPGMPAGSRLFTNKWAYSSPGDVERGDIVVFEREENGIRYTFIWRVVALPGERVEAADESLSIDGKPVERHHVRQEGDTRIFKEQIGAASYEIAYVNSPKSPLPGVSITVPPGHFFVMGDNRFGARDSRYFGPIPFSSIIGKKL
jgi:signal peptidase I